MIRRFLRQARRSSSQQRPTIIWWEPAGPRWTKGWANDEVLIPAATRPDITVHHKYGQLDGSLHDAALLTFREATYALVIYTESADTSDEAERTELIHELTETVVDALFPPAPPGP